MTKEISYKEGEQCNRLLVIRDLTDIFPEGLFTTIDANGSQSIFFKATKTVSTKPFTVKIELIID